MMNNILTPMRALLLAAALAFSMQAAVAQSSGEPPRTTPTARTRSDAPATHRDESSQGGVLIILGIVGGLIVLAWICSRVGDNRTDTVAS
jgi:hypothetical protein